MGQMRAGALLIVAALMAATGAAVRAQGPPKTLRIAVGIDADTLDPAGQTTTTVANMVDYVYETLVRADYAAGKVAPQLATSWTVSRDGLTYLFRLRQGVTFQDGTPFDAEAVKFTFDRLLDLKTRVPLRFLVDTIKEVQALDPFTVRFQLSKPSP
ncbi:MAG: ABC transporter substrate-binding protein, partial [Bacillati bacterium ANGP1]